MSETRNIDIARGWVKDVVCNPEEVDGEEDIAIRCYVEKHYEGGWEAFLEECC